jgi:hypothetical protein
MSTTDTCQIDQYVEAANGNECGACPNLATHTIGLTISSVTFYYKLCPDCWSRVLKAAKLQEASMRRMLEEIR